MKLFFKMFIKDYKNTKDSKVRAAYGKLAGLVGIITNILIATVKILVGSLIAFSPAIVADGINNFSDALSSIITLFGFKLSERQADENHPFGHQRFEYITGMIISFIILFIGICLFKDSAIGIYNLILGNPMPIKTDNIIIIIILLALSVGAKIWQGLFYRASGKAIDSEALIANSKDSFNDSLTTVAVIISTLVFYFTQGKVNIDSIAGLIVSLFIIFAGIDVFKETMTPLLGAMPSKEEVDQIAKKITSYEGILGIHDLVFHDYGPSKKYVTVHCEVDRDVDVMLSHDRIDNIERDFRVDLGIDLTIHMDPVDIHDEMTNELKELVARILNEYDPELTFHDFRIVKGPTHINILFDVVTPVKYDTTPQNLKQEIIDRIHKINPNYHAVIQVDQFYNRITE